ncbi:lectin protein kinase family protein [Prunus dulcis]|uniref:Lectin protein kinase family protein n=1 Tax=Prunus dulcis TaxID=3755 RepID=A0A4Y1RZ27_PRUDU|nr:lectin protein kinase family protein [Prunus dulcis]
MGLVRRQHSRSEHQSYPPSHLTVKVFLPSIFQTTPISSLSPSSLKLRNPAIKSDTATRITNMTPFSFLLLIPCLFSAAAITTISAANTISPGSTLSASNPNQFWSSPNATFSFGFLPSDPPLRPLPSSPPFSTPAASPYGPPAMELPLTPAAPFNSSPPAPSASSTAPALLSGTPIPPAAASPPPSLKIRATWCSATAPFRSGPASTTRPIRWCRRRTSLWSIGILSISDLRLATAVIVAYSSDYAEAGDILRFLKLGSDGNLRIYSSTRGSGTIIERWAAVTDQCEVFGYCGDMGVCSYNNSNPVCGCMSQNFELVDSKDSRKGCKRKMEIEDCPQSVTMLDLVHTRFLTYPPETESQIFFVGISACRLNCLVNSACDASTSLSDGTGLCYYKTPGFLSGYHSPAMSSSSYIKVCGPVIPNPSSSLESAGKKKDWKLRAWIVVVAVVATLLGLMALEGGTVPTLVDCPLNMHFLSMLLVHRFSSCIRSFSAQLRDSRRSLGKEDLELFKGILANRTVVAVKQLEGIEQGEKQFRMEVATISSTHHLNLVRLIGFCSEGRHRLLVYEFMKNGSLDNFLFATAEQSGKLLNWESRFNIALGTARGITYLHEECRDCIVHCDIKPENILIDENFNAKVSDFGLAKLVNPKDHRYRTLTSVRGTRGYLAPEWLANLPITSKSDIYSYGMVLLEIVSGRRNFEVSEETNRKKFSLWAFEEFEKGNIKGIVDKRLVDQDVDMDQVTRAIQVTFWCIHEQPSHRPMMGKVVQMLEGITDIEKPPAPRAAIDVPTSGTDMNVSSNVSALSTAAASAPAPSSFSSFQISGVSSLTSGRNIEKATASLIHSDPN